MCPKCGSNNCVIVSDDIERVSGPANQEDRVVVRVKWQCQNCQHIWEKSNLSK